MHEYLLLVHFPAHAWPSLIRVHNGNGKKKRHRQLVWQEQEGKVAVTVDPGFCNKPTRPVKRHTVPPPNLSLIHPTADEGPWCPKSYQSVNLPKTRPAWLHFSHCFGLLVWCCPDVGGSWSETRAPPYPSSKGELEPSSTPEEEGGLPVWSRAPIARLVFDLIEI